VRVSLKAVNGVDSVDVGLEKGLAVVKMKPNNTVTLKQLNDAISKNGFTMKDSNATIAGTVTRSNGKTVLQVSGSKDELELVPDSGVAPIASAAIGNAALVVGTIPEPPKGKMTDSMRYQSVETLSK
jgi:copper chaperone CopZ